jgi:hypothetical protein
MGRLTGPLHCWRRLFKLDGLDQGRTLHEVALHDAGMRLHEAAYGDTCQAMQGVTRIKRPGEKKAGSTGLSCLRGCAF